jgi:hypothetical protein
MDELADWMRVGGEKRSTRTEFSLRDWQTKQENKTFLDSVVRKRNPDEKKFNNDVQDTHYPQVKFGYRTG